MDLKAQRESADRLRGRFLTAVNSFYSASRDKCMRKPQHVIDTQSCATQHEKTHFAATVITDPGL